MTGNITSDVLCLSFDSLSSPQVRLKLPHQLSGSHPLGWGFGWYPEDKHAASVAKDPAAWNTDVKMNALQEGSDFRSTIYFAKVKGSARGYTHRETQPFTRSYAGRDWLFIHNGDLDKSRLEALQINRSPFLQPLGKTDSELAFCYLLGKMQESGVTRLADLDPELLLSWLVALDALGSADCFLADGTTTACFYGTQSERALFYSRLTPPDHANHLDSEAATLDLNDPRDALHTVMIVSSAPFSNDGWQKMEPGQLILLRRGAIVWNNRLESGKSIPPKNEPIAAMPLANSGKATTAGQAIVNLRSITHAPDGMPLGFRRFDITHVTEYNYTQPVEHSTHVFRLMPTEDALQEVEAARITVSSDGEEIRFDDVFGNESIHYTITKPYRTLTIESTSRVKLFSAAPDDYGLSQRRALIPLVWMPWQRQMMMPYLLPAELPETQLRALTDYAMSFVERNDFHLMDSLRDINFSIYRDYRYLPGSTSLNTTPFEVFASRAGVCQDFANLFICMAQLLSVPARYRMGYIYTGQDHANQIQSDASHAWVEIYLPYIGWRGFDPTNGVEVRQNHVRVACGRNYRDATPTSGTIFRGGGYETLDVRVKMLEVA